MKKFIENFVEQLDSTTVDMLSAETKFRELEEWSSLAALSVIVMLDEVYDVTVNGEDMRKAQTIGELFEIVKEKQ